MTCKSSPEDHPIESSRRCATRGARVFAAAFLGFVLAACGDSSAPDERPNVLLITLDTVRFDRLGCNGHAAARTPNLDALAQRGARFERAYAHTPYTLPSHATLLTGLYPRGHGVHVNFQGAVHPDSPLLSAALHERGYRTGAFLATSVLDRRFGLARAFDVYDDLNERGVDAAQQVERPGDEVTQSAVRWLAESSNAPFFAWVHYYDAHDPYAPPEGFRDFDDPYDGEIAFVDHQVGLLVRELERSGRMANTLIVVTSDHGEAFGEHGEEGHGLLVYDTTMHVPMIVAGPAPIRSGTTARDLVGLVDVFPTVMELVGAPTTAGVEGRSFAAALRGEALSEVALQIESEYPLRAYSWAPLYGLIAGPWKYIRAPSEELYDLIEDPLEQHDRSAAHPDVRDALSASLTRMRESGVQREAGDVHLGIDARDALSKLGYVEGAEVDASGSVRGLADPKAMVHVMNAATRARALLRVGRNAEALAIVAPLIEASPQSGHLWVIQGSAQLALRQAQAAVRSFEKSLESFPESTERLRFLGDALAAAGRQDEALARYREALRLDPEDGQSEGRIGGFLARAGKFDEALPHFQRFVALEPNSANARTNLANGLFALGRVPQGIAELERALRIDPRCGPAHRAMYTANRMSKGRASAITALRAGMAALPEDPFYASRLAWELCTDPRSTSGAWTEAVELARACVAKSPQDPVLLDVLGAALARKSEFTEAIRVADAALRQAETAGNAELSGAIQRRLGLYRAGQPYLE